MRATSSSWSWVGTAGISQLKDMIDPPPHIAVKTIRGFSLRRGRRLAARLAQAIEKNRDDDDAAEQDLLDVSANFQQVHGVRQHGDEERPQNDRPDAADAPLQADASDDCGGDAFKHQAAAEIRLARSGPCGEHQRAERSQQRADEISKAEKAFARQTGEIGGAGIVADQVKRSPEYGVVQQEIESQADQDCDRQRNRNSRNEYAVIEQPAKHVRHIEDGAAARNRRRQSETNIEASKGDDKWIDSQPRYKKPVEQADQRAKPEPGNQAGGHHNKIRSAGRRRAGHDESAHDADRGDRGPER